MMPVAMTKAKYPGCRSRTAAATLLALLGCSSDPMVTVAAGAGFGGPGSAAAAVDDVGPPQVPQRSAPGVHEPAEWPHRPDEPRGGGVHLVDDRRAGDRGDVRGAAEQAPEPGRDGGAVVVSVPEKVDEQGRDDPGDDDDQQQHQCDVVDRAGGSPDPGDEQPPAGQDHNPGDDQHRGEGS